MRATDATIRLRIEDVLRIRLDGAEGWDARRYVAEQEQANDGAGEPPWCIPEGGKPLSERQIRNYVRAADKLIDESCRKSRRRLLRRHLAQRRALYARAVSQGDIRAALAVLDSEAKLEGLLDDEVSRQIEELKRRVARLTGGDNGDGGGGAGGVAGTQPGAGPAGGGPAGNPAAGPAEGGPGGDLHGREDDAGPLADLVAPQPLFPDAAAL
jgi:hypothetical protein